MAESKKEILIRTALRLFCERGFRATGIDTILEEAGVAKMTLYNHFRGKNDLILASLRLLDEKFRKDMAAFVERKASKDAERVLLVFDYLEQWFDNNEFYGCPFLKASGEFPDPGDPIHRSIVEHKFLVTQYIKDLLPPDIEKERAPEVATQIGLILEGAITSAQISGKTSRISLAKSTARKLMNTTG